MPLDAVPFRPAVGRALAVDRDLQRAGGAGRHRAVGPRDELQARGRVGVAEQHPREPDLRPVDRLRASERSEPRRSVPRSRNSSGMVDAADGERAREDEARGDPLAGPGRQAEDAGHRVHLGRPPQLRLAAERQRDVVVEGDLAGAGRAQVEVGGVVLDPRAAPLARAAVERHDRLASPARWRPARTGSRWSARCATADGGRPAARGPACSSCA